MIVSKNPANGTVLKEYVPMTSVAVQEKITQAHAAFELWRFRSFEERKELLVRMAEYLREHARDIGMLATLEMGKPITQAVAEVEKCAWVCEHYAVHAVQYLKEEPVRTEATDTYVRFDPLGVLLLVMPWNYPFWQVFRVAAPALMAGNTILLKHASNVPQCALKIEEVFSAVGFDDSVFGTLLISSSEVKSVVEHPIVQAISLTGSERAGGIVASQAALQIKKSVLELGGSDPFIVLPDADLTFACETGVTARLQNNGQSCIAAKRFLVHESVADAFIARYIEILRNKKMGDPRQDDTDVGPLVSIAARDDIASQVQRSVEMGARIVYGGTIPDGPGAYFEPTLLTDVTPGMPAFDEELFGDVASVITFQTDEQAVALANETPFGLGASIWTKDIARAKRMIPKIDAGSVFVNAMVKSDPRLPIGGIKKSGFGRELGEYGIKEFVNIKTVWIQ